MWRKFRALKGPHLKVPNPTDLMPPPGADVVLYCWAPPNREHTEVCSLRQARLAISGQGPEMGQGPYSGKLEKVGTECARGWEDIGGRERPVGRERPKSPYRANGPNGPYMEEILGAASGPARAMLEQN